jgi:hypothetical protein
MKKQPGFTLHLLWVVCLLTCPLPSSGSAPVATKEGGSPDAYTTPKPQTAEKTLENLKSLAAAGKIDQSAILAANVHGASVIDFGLSASGPAALRSAVMSPNPRIRTLDVAVSTGPRFDGVNNRGLYDGKQYLEVYGSFQGMGDLALNCGTGGRFFYPTTVTYRSDVQINIVLSPLPNLLDRQCTLKGTASGTPSFTFALPGLTCNDWQALCPGETVGVFKTTATDGSEIRIDIRNSLSTQDVLTPADVDTIENVLARIPPDNLKNVHFIQFEPDFHLYTWTPSEAGNGGGIYIGLSPLHVVDVVPVGFGVGLLLYHTLTASEVAFWDMHPYDVWNTETGFAVRYYDWLKGTNDLEKAIWYSFDPSLNADQVVSMLQSALVMGTHFYYPKTGMINIGYQQLVPVTFTNDRLQFGRYVFYLDGNTIVAESESGGNKKVYQKPIPIPDLFLQVVLRI